MTTKRRAYSGRNRKSDLIRNPKLAGIYHWMTGDVRNVGFLYKTTEYKGELISSEEGIVSTIQ